MSVAPDTQMHIDALKKRIIAQVREHPGCVEPSDAQWIADLAVEGIGDWLNETMPFMGKQMPYTGREKWLRFYFYEKGDLL